MNSLEMLIADLYKQGFSPYEIAEKIPGSNHMKIRRALKKMGIATRDKGEAQSNALKTGRSTHPKKKRTNAEGVYNTVNPEQTAGLEEENENC